jgi:hypothetical protein
VLANCFMSWYTHTARGCTCILALRSDVTAAEIGELWQSYRLCIGPVEGSDGRGCTRRARRLGSDALGYATEVSVTFGGEARRPRTPRTFDEIGLCAMRWTL